MTYQECISLFQGSRRRQKRIGPNTYIERNENFFSFRWGYYRFMHIFHDDTFCFGSGYIRYGIRNRLNQWSGFECTSHRNTIFVRKNGLYLTDFTLNNLYFIKDNIFVVDIEYYKEKLYRRYDYLRNYRICPQNTVATPRIFTILLQPANTEYITTDFIHMPNTDTVATWRLNAEADGDTIARNRENAINEAIRNIELVNTPDEEVEP